MSFEYVCIAKFSSSLFIVHIATFYFSWYPSEWSAIMTDEKAQQVAIALSQNLILFYKGCRASARTPITLNNAGHQKRAMLYCAPELLLTKNGIVLIKERDKSVNDRYNVYVKKYADLSYTYGIDSIRVRCVFFLTRNFD
jgi:hypothetical protein